ncbi:MAG TPA: substrate-binding domain-containing protein [Clostridiaceae bacterium]|jgi:simple sugar transport system substrate-binding protein|nr:substrate-binding domain-containing protein [Clostridiaceae bacterium]
MKKLVSMVLALMLVFSLVACDAKDKAKDDGKITVGVVQTNANESDWRTANTKSMNEAFAAAGFETKMVFGEGDHAKQIAQAQQLIQEEVDYLVILGLQSAGWEDVAKAAKEAGIPLIMADRELELSEDLYTAMVCSDFEAEGVKAVDWLKAQNMDTVDIVVLGGDTGSSAQLGRSKAIEEGAATNGWNIVFNQNMKGWDETLAKQAVTDLIASGKEFNVIYAENDNMARGACDAMDAAGITYGKDGDVKVIAFDANKWALEKVLAGEFNLDIECNPLHGPRLVSLIQSLEKGEKVEKNVYVEEEMFDAETITQAIVDARSY